MGKEYSLSVGFCSITTQPPLLGAGALGVLWAGVICGVGALHGSWWPGVSGACVSWVTGAVTGLVPWGATAPLFLHWLKGCDRTLVLFSTSR